MSTKNEKKSPKNEKKIPKSDAECFTFYRSFYECGEQLGEKKHEFYAMILAYIFDGIEPKKSNPLYPFFTLVKPVLELGQKRRSAGKKGGRPQGDFGLNQNDDLVKTKSAIWLKPKVQFGLKPGYGLVKTDIEKDIDIDTEKEEDNARVRDHPPATQKTKKKGKETQRVVLSDDEVSSILSKYGQKVLDEYVRRMDTHLAKTSANYSSHYATIMSWIRQDSDTPKFQSLVSSPEIPDDLLSELPDA